MIVVRAVPDAKGETSIILRKIDLLTIGPLVKDGILRDLRILVIE